MHWPDIDIHTIVNNDIHIIWALKKLIFFQDRVNLN